jgi:predicted 3-demethylubiquinone-9 3-methyltransferase (glyoxalase superfamily)
VKELTMNKVTPFLWFDKEAGEAAAFYLSIFPEARKTGELLFGDAGPGPKGGVLTVSIELAGQAMTFMNGGPGHPLTDAFSFSVTCETQEEIDGYWEKLTEGGSEIQCGWLKDKFGVSWQIVPVKLPELLRHPGAMRAMMKMVKMDIAALEAAAGE